MSITAPNANDLLAPQEHTILVIDDNPANLEVTTDYLREYGFQVLVARSGEVGLERAQRAQPDLILLDVIMPGINGFETCTRLRADATTQDIPVIFMTALTEAESKVKGFQVGAVDYVVKPIEKHELMARVLTHLRLRELNRRLEQKVQARTAELQRSHQQVRQIINTVPEGVVLLDNQAHILLANPTASEALAHLAGVCVGDVLTHLGDWPLATVLTSPPVGLWHEIAAAERCYQIIARPLEAGATPEGWVIVIRDVTHQREFDQRVQQQERLAAIGQLAAGIAHDFNNILAVIVLYAHMELRAPSPLPRLRERLTIIADQAQRATILIQQILDFSRRAVFERRPLDLIPFLEEQVRLLERTLPENIKLSLTHPATEMIIHADPTRLQQVIMNLAVNARDAMPRGGELRLDLRSLSIEKGKHAPLPGMRPGAWIQLTVADTGSGIAPEILPHIFEPFFTTKGPLGTGLGLAQVYGIVKQHEGDLNVNSKAGQGATFTLYFQAAGSPAAQADLALSHNALPQGQGETLLVVEDNLPMRAALIETLHSLNYRVMEAANGHTALSIIEKHTQEIALVLSDMIMPEMGGQALFQAIQERGWPLPIIILSGHPLESELQSMQGQRIAGWLPKPPDIDRLAQLLQQVLHPAM